MGAVDLADFATPTSSETSFYQDVTDLLRRTDALRQRMATALEGDLYVCVCNLQVLEDAHVRLMQSATLLGRIAVVQRLTMQVQTLLDAEPRNFNTINALLVEMRGAWAELGSAQEMACLEPLCVAMQRVDATIEVHATAAIHLLVREAVIATRCTDPPSTSIDLTPALPILAMKRSERTEWIRRQLAELGVARWRETWGATDNPLEVWSDMLTWVLKFVRDPYMTWLDGQAAMLAPMIQACADALQPHLATATSEQLQEVMRTTTEWEQQMEEMMPTTLLTDTILSGCQPWLEEQRQRVRSLMALRFEEPTILETHLRWMGDLTCGPSIRQAILQCIVALLSEYATMLAQELPPATAHEELPDTPLFHSKDVNSLCRLYRLSSSMASYIPSCLAWRVKQLPLELRDSVSFSEVTEAFSQVALKSRAAMEGAVMYDMIPHIISWQNPSEEQTRGEPSPYVYQMHDVLERHRRIWSQMRGEEAYLNLHTRGLLFGLIIRNLVRLGSSSGTDSVPQMLVNVVYLDSAWKESAWGRHSLWEPSGKVYHSLLQLLHVLMAPPERVAALYGSYDEGCETELITLLEMRHFPSDLQQRIVEEWRQVVSAEESS